MGCKDPGRYIPIMFLLYSWISSFGVPIKVPLTKENGNYYGISYKGYMGLYAVIGGPWYLEPT